MRAPERGKQVFRSQSRSLLQLSLASGPAPPHPAPHRPESARPARPGSGLRTPQQPRCPCSRRAQNRSQPVGADPAGRTSPSRAGFSVHSWTQRFFFGFHLLGHIWPELLLPERAPSLTTQAALRGRWPALPRGKSRRRLAPDRTSV